MHWSRLSTSRARFIVEPRAARHSRQPICLHQILRAEAGIEPSVGSIDDSYDNALVETINGIQKTEVIYRRGPWLSFEAVEYATLEWVNWFNNRGLLNLSTHPTRRSRAAIFLLCWTTSPLLRDLNQLASGKTGAVHPHRGDESRSR